MSVENLQRPPVPGCGSTTAEVDQQYTSRVKDPDRIVDHGPPASNQVKHVAEHDSAERRTGKGQIRRVGQEDGKSRTVAPVLPQAFEHASGNIGAHKLHTPIAQRQGDASGSDTDLEASSMLRELGSEDLGEQLHHFVREAPRGVVIRRGPVKRNPAHGAQAIEPYDRRVRLNAEEGRVIGSLIEKQLTTPQQYPLSLNALLLSCNQSSNREPVVNYDERTVDNALMSLKSSGLVRFVHPSHGRSVTRYRQVLEERLELTDTQLALIGALVLRGPQTAAELRARTERMAPSGIAQVDADLERLSEGPEPVTFRLARRPGQKEERWIQLLTDTQVTVESDGVAEPDTEGPDATGAAAAAKSPAVVGRLASVEAELVQLRIEVHSLRADLDDLRTQPGS